MGVINTDLVFKAITLDEILWEKRVDGDYKRLGVSFPPSVLRGRKPKDTAEEIWLRLIFKSNSALQPHAQEQEKEEANGKEGDTGMRTMLNRS